MTRGHLVLTNARIVTRTEIIHGTVCVDADCITAVDCGRSAVAGALDCEGDYLIPGMVDLHTDNLERHMLPRTSSRWPGLAALLAHDAHVAGVGITTVFDAICLGIEFDVEGRPRDFYRDSPDAMRTAASGGWLRAEHFLHLRCELPGEHVAAQLESLLADPLVRLVSLMDHTPGQRQTTDTTRSRRVAERSGPLTDAEWHSRLEESRRRQRAFAEANRARLVEMMRSATVPLASHDDTTVDHVTEAHTIGIRISEFPTTLAAAKAARGRGMSTVMGAPNVVLGGSQSGNVAAAEVVAAGLLDALASDYAPVSMLHSVFLLAGGEEQRLPSAIAMVTANPAAMVGLDDRGAIEPGLRADLVQVRVGADMPRAHRVWRKGERVA